MLFAHGDNIDIAINSAVEGEIRLLRINGIVCRVVGSDNKRVFIKNIIKLNTECRISAIVCNQTFAVKNNLSSRIDALKLEIELVARRQIGLCKRFFITALASVIIVAAVLTVYSVPSVGKGDRFVMTFLGKSPTGVQQNCFAHRMTPYVWF